jgi:hypothetical protein
MITKDSLPASHSTFTTGDSSIGGIQGTFLMVLDI